MNSKQRNKFFIVLLVLSIGIPALGHSLPSHEVFVALSFFLLLPYYMLPSLLAYAFNIPHFELTMVGPFPADMYGRIFCILFWVILICLVYLFTYLNMRNK